MIQIDAKGGGLVGASARGVSHIRRDKPNQDAIGGFVEPGAALAVVSDGHGADACFRSDRGARFVVAAVEAACRALVWGRATREIGVAEFLALPERIVADWRARVAADAAADPDPRLQGEATWRAYGATCVAALVGEDDCFLMQIGDGDLAIAAPEGELARPLPDDEGLVGEQTYSICLPEAVGLFRTLLLRPPHALARPDFVSVSSDGLSKSFAGIPEFLTALTQWRALAVQRGLEWIERQLEPWLAQCSERGAKDDTSLSIFSRHVTARAN
jgi:hypothetical protein